MLRITRSRGENESLIVRLEGEIRGPWLDAVRCEIAEWRRQADGVGLDLTSVTYVDCAGVDFLRELVGEGIEIAACSSFVSELIQCGLASSFGP